MLTALGFTEVLILNVPALGVAVKSVGMVSPSFKTYKSSAT